MTFINGKDGNIEIRDRYRARVIANYRTRIAEHVGTDYPCLNTDCNKYSEIRDALCGDCETKLFQLCKQIDATIQRLTIIGEEEAFNIARGGVDGTGARNGEAINLTPASLLADELESKAVQFAKWVRWEMPNQQRFNPTYPGNYLANRSEWLAQRPEVLDLLNGYHIDGYLHRDGQWIPSEFVRGLRQIFTDIQKNYPPDDEHIPPRQLPGAPCPACGNEDLWWHPAQRFGQPIAISCKAKIMNDAEEAVKDCNWLCKEDAFEYLARVIAFLKAEKDASEKLAKDVAIALRGGQNMTI